MDDVNRRSAHSDAAMLHRPRVSGLMSSETASIVAKEILARASSRSRSIKRIPMASSSTRVARKARAKAEADFATWLMMAKLGSFDDLPSNAQEVLTNFRIRLDRMSETESKMLAVREVYGRYYSELGGEGTAPELETPSSPRDDNVVRFHKRRKPQTPPSSARRGSAPKIRRPVPPLLIFAIMVAIIAAFKLLTN